MRVFQRFKCKFIFKTQLCYLLCSLTVAVVADVADDAGYRWQPVKKIKRFSLYLSGLQTK